MIFAIFFNLLTPMTLILIIDIRSRPSRKKVGSKIGACHTKSGDICSNGFPS
jgi:hypothetical protein